jgi:hypothetical protein
LEKIMSSRGNSRALAQTEGIAWRGYRGLTKPEAEELLDWLERNGYDHGPLYVQKEGFAVEAKVWRLARQEVPVRHAPKTS